MATKAFDALQTCWIVLRGLRHIVAWISEHNFMHVPLTQPHNWHLRERSVIAQESRTGRL